MSQSSGPCHPTAAFAEHETGNLRIAVHALAIGRVTHPPSGEMGTWNKDKDGIIVDYLICIYNDGRGGGGGGIGPQGVEMMQECTGPDRE